MAKKEKRTRTKKAPIVEKRKRRAALLLIFAVVLLVSLLCMLMSSQEQPGIASYEIYLTVGNYTGFNVNTSALYFGTLMPGTSATRFVLIKNDASNPLEAFFSLNGDAASFISVNESVVLGAYQNTTVEIRAFIPTTAAYGNYTGTLRITSRRVR